MITRVKVTNWKKFPSTEEWSFDNGIQLISGSNTSGKSSVLEAIRFAFFGVDEEVDDIPNYDETTQTIVELDFIGKDKELYRIVRGYKKIKRKDESFNFYKVINNQEDYISNDSDDAITAIGIPKDIFTYIMFLKEGEIYRALLRKKNNLSSELSDILNLGRFDLLNINLRETRLSYVKRMKEFARDTTLFISENERKNLIKEIDEYKEKMKEYQERRTKLKDLKRNSEEREKVKGKIQDLSDEKEKFGFIIKELREKYKEKGNLMELLEKEVEQLDKSNNEYESQINNLIQQKSERDGDVSRLKKLVKEIEEFESSEETTCPTCYQKINVAVLVDAKETFSNDLKEKKSSVKKLGEEIDAFKEKQDENSNRIKTLEADLKEIKNAQEEIKKIQSKINEREQELTQIQEEEKIDDFDERLEDLDEKIADSKLDIREKERILNGSEEDIININELEFQEKFIQLVEKKVDEYRAEILEKRLNEVKDTIKDKWSQIWKKNIWSLDFDNNFVPTIRYKESDQTIEQTLRGLSGSEKIMLSVILRAALMEKLVGTKTLILDDPAIFLDSENMKIAANFYRDLIDQKHLDQIILTTFNEDFKNHLQPEQVIELE